MKKKKDTILETGEITLYQASKNDVRFEVRLKKETVWLTQKQIAQLFGIQRPAITKHLRNIFESGELREKSVCSKMEHTAEDGKSYKAQYYNLDAILSVGYRVNSKQATKFRIWATKTLKEHLLHGYTINEKQLFEQSEKFHELQVTVEFLRNKSKKSLLSGQGQEILYLLADYAGTFSLFRSNHATLFLF